jgi:hypothetical protein
MIVLVLNRLVGVSSVGSGFSLAGLGGSDSGSEISMSDSVVSIRASSLCAAREVIEVVDLLEADVVLGEESDPLGDELLEG